ncbi:MAG: hypothetical protein KatS3mg131_1475 [Candidatus Tectimicrobiota bacterium]|nr:MAG: hypothetical protein KatS3mg131_1475 [Candidatus Tectomicrobia bacterium]
MQQVAPSFVPYLTTLASVLVVVALGFLAYGVVRRSLRLLVQRQYLSAPLGAMLQGLARWGIGILVGLLVLQQAGLRVASLWATLLTLAGMVTVGFIAVWSVLSNVLCAVLLVLFGPFRLGDDIEIIEATGGRGLRGEVIGFNALYTTLREVREEGPGEAVVQVPNNVFFQKTLRRRRGNKTQGLETALFAQATPGQAGSQE